MGAISIVAIGVGYWWLTSTNSAARQSLEGIDITLVGEGQTSVAEKLPFDDYPSAKTLLGARSITSAAVAIEWLGATSLTAQALGSSMVTFDDVNEAIVFETADPLRFSDADLATLTVTVAVTVAVTVTDAATPGAAPTISVGGTYAGSEAWSPLEFDPTATGLGFALDLGPTRSALTLSGEVRVGGEEAAIDLGFEVEVAGDSDPTPGEPANSLRVRLVTGEIQLGQVLDVLAERVDGISSPDLGAGARAGFIVSMTIEIDIIDDELSFYAEANIKIRRRGAVTIALALYMSNSELIVALDLPENLTLGDITTAGLGGAFTQIPLPSGGVVARVPQSTGGTPATGAPLLVSAVPSVDARSSAADRVRHGLLVLVAWCERRARRPGVQVPSVDHGHRSS